MTRLLLLIIPALLAGGCGPTPEEQQQSDEAAIRQVEAAQDRHPPVRRLSPQPVTFADLEAQGLSGAGCGFTPETGKGLDPVLYTDSERGVLKLEGQIAVFAADSGSAEFPYGTRERYTGRAMELVLSKAAGEGAPQGEEAVRWPGTLTVRDQWGRIAYDEEGSLECGA